MSKDKTPYLPYKTDNGDYAVNLAFLCTSDWDRMFTTMNSSSPMLDKLRFHNTSIGEEGTNTDRWMGVSTSQILGAIGSALLCNRYGKDFYDVFSLGVSEERYFQLMKQNSPSDITTIFENLIQTGDYQLSDTRENFPPYPNSVYWHLTGPPSEKVLQRKPDLSNKLALIPDTMYTRDGFPRIQVKYLGINHDLTKAALATPGVDDEDPDNLPPLIELKASVSIVQVIYPKLAFESLPDGDFSQKISILAQSQISGSPIFEGSQKTPYEFAGIPDFEEKMEAVKNLLEYYQEAQTEAALVFSESGAPFDFLAYLSQIDEFKSEVKEHFEINGKSTNSSQKFQITMAVDLKVANYAIDAPLLVTGRNQDLVKKINQVGPTSLEYIDLLGSLREEISKNYLYKGAYMPSEPAGPQVSHQLFEDGKLNRIENLFSQEIYTRFIKTSSGSGPAISWLSSLINSLVYTQDSEDKKGKLPPLYTPSASGPPLSYNPDSLEDTFHPGTHATAEEIFSTTTFLKSVRAQYSTPIKYTNPRLIYFLYHLRSLVKMSEKTFSAIHGGCVADMKSKAEAMRTAAKLISDTSTMTPAQLAEQDPGQAAADELKDAELQEPLDPSVFAKRYFQWPQRVDNSYVIPSRAWMVPNSPLVTNPETYKGIRVSLVDELSNKEKIKIIETVRNQPPQTTVPEVLKKRLALQGISPNRRLTSLSLGGASSFINSKGEFEFSYDINDLMAKRNRSAADQIGDELFKITPRAPAKIRNLDDAYKFFLAKLDLASIAREALKCTFLKHSLDDVIEMMCDELLEKFFGMFGSDPDEFVKELNRIKAKQYKAGPLDLTYSVQQVLKDLEDKFREWSQAQMVQMSENIVGEKADAVDSSKPPPVGSPSFYASVSSGFDGSTKRMLCELLIGGAMGVINLLGTLFKKLDETPTTEELNRPGNELKFKECDFSLSLDLPDRLPHWSKILESILVQVEGLARDYVEQFVIIPLRNSLLEILSCNESDDASVDDFLDESSLDALFGALSTDPELTRLLKLYVKDVLGNLTILESCGLLKGEPSTNAMGVCSMVLTFEKYSTSELQTLLSTEGNKINFFKSMGEKADFEVCRVMAAIGQTSDLCRESPSPSVVRLRTMLASYGFSPEEVDYQMSLEAEQDKAKLKHTLTAFFGSPENIVSPSQIQDIVSRSDALTKINTKALSQVMDPINIAMRNYDYNDFQTGYPYVVGRKHLTQLQDNVANDPSQSNQDALDSFLADLQNNGWTGATQFMKLIGLWKYDKLEGANTDVSVSIQKNNISIDNYDYHEEKVLGDPVQLANSIYGLSQISEFLANIYGSSFIDPFFSIDTSQLDPQKADTYSANFRWIGEGVAEVFKNYVASTSDAETTDSLVRSLTQMPFSDFILDVDNLKPIISNLSSQNFRELPEGGDVPPTHLYDAVFEGVVVLYTRIFLVELMLSAPYIYKVFSPERILDSCMVRDYIAKEMYPDLGEGFNKIKEQLARISATYLVPKTNVNINYEASLAQLNQLSAEFFNKLKNTPCKAVESHQQAVPLSFEDSQKVFNYVDAGDTMLFQNSLLENEEKFVFEKYCTFDKVNIDQLTSTQVQALSSTGILNTQNTAKQVLSEKDLFKVYKILYDQTDWSSESHRNLIPLGFYVDESTAPGWEIRNEAAEGRNKNLFYSPNFQTYKMWYGLMAQKYFRTLILQFGNGPVDPKPKPGVEGAKAWPSSWFEMMPIEEWKEGESVYEAYPGHLQDFVYDPSISVIGSGLSSKGFSTQAIIAKLLNYETSFSDFIGYEDLDSPDKLLGEGIGLGLYEIPYDAFATQLQNPGDLTEEEFNLAKVQIETLYWLPLIGATKLSELGYDVESMYESLKPPPPTPEQIAAMEGVKIADIRDLFLRIEREFFPESNSSINNFKVEILKNVDDEWDMDGPRDKTFKKYYNPEDYTHNEWYADREVKEKWLYKMFFPNYYRRHDGVNVAPRAVFRTEDWTQDADLILEGPISQPSFDPEIAMTTNPVFVRDFTYKHFNGLVKVGGNTKDIDGTTKGSDLPQIRKAPGTPGRLVGKFMFDEMWPGGSKYLLNEETSTKLITQNQPHSMSLLSKEEFISSFNEYRNSINEMYGELISAVTDSALSFLGSEGTPGEAASIEGHGIPTSIIKLEDIPNTNYMKAIDEEGNEKTLYFKRINVRVPTRLFQEKGNEDGDWFSSNEFHLTKSGVSYVDDAGTLCFIDTKVIPVIRVYLVEDPLEDYTALPYYNGKFELQSSSENILAETKICDIFENFRYGLRLSLPIAPGFSGEKSFVWQKKTEDAILFSYGLGVESEVRLRDIFRDAFNAPNAYLQMYYREKKYLNELISGADTITFAEAFKNNEYISDENPAVPGPAMLLPLASYEYSLEDIRNSESGMPLKTNYMKDVFKNFPIEANASPQSKVSPYLDASETYGEKMAYELYCRLTHDNPELKKLFAEGLKVQNIASFLTIQARAQLQLNFEQYQGKVPFKVTKDALQNIVDYIINNRNGDDI